MDILSLHGAELAPYLDGLGQLRISVFREYPYLYDGSLEYERDYLQTYLSTPRSLVVLVLDAGRVVGATTCIPLLDEAAEFQQPFLQAGHELAQVCYFGESILLPAYRGRGLGRVFFQRREQHAQALGLPITAFCAVDRPATHPRRPADYEPLDAMWQKMGYTQQPGMQATFHWKEIDEATESAKTLTFWLKRSAV